MEKETLTFNRWQFCQANIIEWLPAQVPGCVHTDLLKNKKIEDPFFRLNEKNLQWIEHEDWIYRTVFDCNEEQLNFSKAHLVFDGLDTYADVYLNDKLLFSSDNMFIRWEFECKDILKSKENVLKIYFHSPIKIGTKLYDSLPYRLPANNDEGEKGTCVYTRKAQYMYGWDWAPRLVTSGIWRKTYLTFWKGAKIESVQIVQKDITANWAQLSAIVDVTSNLNGTLRASVQYDGQFLGYTDFNAKLGENLVSVPFKIMNPKLWYPNGLGAAHLYDFKVVVESKSGISDSKNIQYGIRTVDLIRQKDEAGESFYFKINGIPVFMKGANFIPSDFFPSRIKPEMYLQAVNDAVDANMNMLRIWGGGIYEDEYFYQLCNEKGIMVWQDFMFACGMYPGEDWFLANLKNEFTSIIKELRNHPSIVLWCGNNELHEGWHTWGWKEERNQEAQKYIWDSYTKIFDHLIPDLLKQLDPTKPYWPSSPMGSNGAVVNYFEGDVHYWKILRGDLIADYGKNVGRFMSEYGFKSYPEMKTLNSYSIAEDHHIFSEVLESHQGWIDGASIVRDNLLHEYRQPKNFENYVYLSIVLQAEAIKFAIEAHRRAKPYCMGSLYWQMNDCWPCASWASIDYFGNWKALHYKIKEVFARTIISVQKEETNLDFFVVNDHLAEIQGIMKIQICDFNGKVVRNQEIEAQINASSSQKVFQVHEATFLTGIDRRNHYMVIELFKSGNSIASCIYYFTPKKFLALEKAAIEYSIEKTQDYWSMKLNSKKLVKNVCIEIADFNCKFSDNYFDLLPAKEKVITIKSGAIELLNDNIKIFSVNDSYDSDQN